ncbi:MAG: hypothetical protein ABWX76_10140 [Leifsonia flava]
MTDNTTKPAGRTARRTLIWAAVIVVALGAGLAFTLLNQPAPATPAASEPSPTASPSVTVPPTPTPTSTPTPTPTEEPGAPLPVDCQKIYTPAFLELWKSVELNDPSLDDVAISRFDAVEGIRESLQGIECKWGVPTEGGMSTAVNRATADDKSALVAAATGEGFTCDEASGITICAISDGPNSDDPDGWVVAEELYFRDGLVVTTWRASTAGSMEDSTQPVYATLWP